MITVIAYFQELFSFSFVIVNNTCTGRYRKIDRLAALAKRAHSIAIERLHK